MRILIRLRHPRKELAALALKPGWAKALRRHLRMFWETSLKFIIIAITYPQKRQVSQYKNILTTMPTKVKHSFLSTQKNPSETHLKSCTQLKQTRCKWRFQPWPNHKGYSQRRTRAVVRNSCCLQCHTALPGLRIFTGIIQVEQILHYY